MSVRADGYHPSKLGVFRPADGGVTTCLPLLTNRKEMMVHPAQAALLDFFAHEHLPEGIMRDTSHECSILAHHLTYALEDTTNGAELTTGLRKLLEAKDCFVRAAMSVPKANDPEPSHHQTAVHGEGDARVAADDPPPIPDNVQTFAFDRLPSEPRTWPSYRKKVDTKAIKIAGQFAVETSEGPLMCQDGYLAVDARGYPYPIATEEFALIYEPVKDEPLTEPITGA